MNASRFSAGSVFAVGIASLGLALLILYRLIDRKPDAYFIQVFDAKGNIVKEYGPYESFLSVDGWTVYRSKSDGWIEIAPAFKPRLVTDINEVPEEMR